jgi:hypothetical protein
MCCLKFHVTVAIVFLLAIDDRNVAHMGLEQFQEDRRTGFLTGGYLISLRCAHCSAMRLVSTQERMNAGFLPEGENQHV